MTNVPKILPKLKTYQVCDFIADLAGENGDQIYLGIGRAYPWPVNDSTVPAIADTVDSNYQVFRELVALKDVLINQGCAVVPRSDWSNGTTYTAYANNFDLYTDQRVVQVNGTVTFSNTTVIGTNTTFNLDFSNNNILQVPGDGAAIQPTNYEVISIASNTQLQINLIPQLGPITANAVYKVTNTYPNFAYNFYVRNTYDQVFLCLSNNNSIPSNTMPAISLGGALPNSQYIITADGYNWKYLYTIPSGLKQNFFDTIWMPVVIENQVANSAVNGRLDVIKIVNGGSGYNNSASSLSAPILTVVGDGTSANLTAIVSSAGTITGVNVLNAGNNYTTANIVISTTGTGGNIQAIIGPPGGWGANAYYDLGVRTVIISVPLANTENGTIPTKDALNDFFEYRQIVLLLNPTYANGAGVAQGTNYDLTTSIALATNVSIAMNDLVFQSPTGLIANATFQANCVYFDNTVNILHINNLSGTFTPQSTLYATKNTTSAPYATVQAFNATAPVIQPFSGHLLWIENRTGVTRAPNQTESVRLILTF